MSDKVLASFTIGQGRALPVHHTGPKLYTVGGETFGTNNVMTGIAGLGLGSFDFIVGGPSNSGNYFVYCIPQSTGECKTYKFVWVTATTGIPTTTQATAIDLSAETVRLLVIGR